ncbi:phosphoserine phosphatase SerB [Kordiimonas pumila]|uniref:Phosphoserine phosphatase n=1 Tax=Kordiimonas pumila TaxID=2161677 RepID=A0ABV7D8D7_9PROT|nr:phosphoserine phosphatase SerB [Kordiimonas pumila]
MDIALTLVAPSDQNGSLKEAETLVLQKLGSRDAKPTILSEGIAIDYIAEFSSLEEAKHQLIETLNGISGLDWCLQPALNRKKKLLLADMDSTMITVECIDELADFMGLKEKVAAITEAAMRGELNFEAALIERVALLEGLTEAQLAECYAGRINLMDGAKALVRTMRKNGAYTALVSGGFTYFTGKVAEAIGFHMNRANILEMDNGKLTGTVAMPICGANTKLETLKALAAEHKLGKHEIMAVGDGANDIPMIEAAGLGVAYHAKPKTQAAATCSVKYGDLRTLLYYQGYTDAEITE